MKPKFILLLSLAIIAVLSLYFFTAKLAKKKSDDILEKFKTIDSSLKKSGGSLDNAKISSNYEIASITTDIILYIDSLREFVRNGPHPGTVRSQTLLTRPQAMKLKNKLVKFNSFLTTARDSAPADTISLAKVESGDRLVEWETYYFTNEPKEAVLTFLAYIKMKVLNIQHNNIQP